MGRISVISYSPSDFLEEAETTLGHCRDLVEKFPVTWINIVDPDNRIARELETLFSLHPLSVEDAMSPEMPPKVETYEDYLFIVARTINWAEEISTEPLSIFLSKKYLITVHHRVFPQLEDSRIRLRRKSPKLLHSGPDFLCYTILDALVDSYFPHLDRLGDVIDELEDRALSEPTKETASTIHAVKRDLMRLRAALRPQRDAFTMLARSEIGFFKKETITYLRNVFDHTIVTLDMLDNYRELASSLMEVYLTSVSNSTNEVMKVLTVIATIMLPLSLVASVYGMNFQYMPFLDSPLGFWASVALMVAIAAAMLGYFWRKGWV